jgi:pantoate--beta-alanine ligase
MSEILEGVDRPGHFTGVATVVAILLNTFRPARAYFGEKDYQQLAIIRQMHGDLQLPGDIVSCPTIRDVDGLALSSRNARLSATARATAAVIPRALDAISKAYWSGIHERVELRSIGLQTLESAPAVTVRYLELVVADSLALANTISADTRVLVAVEIDGVRLIDNIALGRGIQSS